MYLVDTNIFLEVLLGQEKAELCKNFLTGIVENIEISDFTLHSIGVILNRYHKIEVFQDFIDEVVNNIQVLSLPLKGYTNLIQAMNNFHFDFDDAYQYSLAKLYHLKIVSMDKDFMKINDIEVINFNNC